MELETSYTVEALIQAHNHEETKLSNAQIDTEAAERSFDDRLRELDNYYVTERKRLEDELANAREHERVVKDGFERFRSQKFILCEHTALNPPPTPPINSAIRTPAATVRAFRSTNEPRPTPEVEAHSDVYDEFNPDSYSDRVEDYRTQKKSWRNLVDRKSALLRCPKCNTNAYWVNAGASKIRLAVYFKRADFIQHAKDVHGLGKGARGAILGHRRPLNHEELTAFDSNSDYSIPAFVYKSPRHHPNDEARPPNAMAMTATPTYHTASASRSGKGFDDSVISGAGFFSDEHMEEDNELVPEPPRSSKRKKRNTMKTAMSRDSVDLIGANDNKELIDTPPHKRPSKGHPLLHKSLEGWVELRCIIKDKHTTKECHANARMADGKAVFFDVGDFRAHALECHDIRNFDIMRHCAYRKLTDEEVKSIDTEFSQEDHSQIPLLVEKEPRKEQDIAPKSPAARPDPTVLRGMLTRRKSNAARPQIRFEAMP